MRASVNFSCAVFLLGFSLAACRAQESGKELEEVTLQLAWTHQALFAGFYTADQMGFYAEEGLSVTFLPRTNPSSDIIAPVVDGTADFGLDYGAGILLARAADQPVTAIATIYRRHPLVFLTLANSGITRPQDFPGHTIRMLTPGSSSVAFQAMMTRLGLDPGSVKQVDVGFDLPRFFAGEVDIYPGFVNFDVLAARDQGIEVNLIFPEDYGVHLYGYTLFTTDRLIADNPDLVLRFLRATLRGWLWAIENPSEAGPHVVSYDPALDPVYQTSVLEAGIPLVQTGEDQIGWMREEMWAGMRSMLMEQGILAEAVDLDQVYTLRFLNEIYGAES